MKELYPGFQEIRTLVQGNTVQLFLRESGLRELVPATRLSDGTLRYLALLAVLLHPFPLALVCLEEPELGLHPDAIHELAGMLVDASQRTQLFVTTHSEQLVGALSFHPESIIVCERGEAGSQMRRLDKEQLSHWLQQYTLGELWRMGEIGGTRW